MLEKLFTSKAGAIDVKMDGAILEEIKLIIIKNVGMVPRKAAKLKYLGKFFLGNALCNLSRKTGKCCNQNFVKVRCPRTVWIKYDM